MYRVLLPTIALVLLGSCDAAKEVSAESTQTPEVSNKKRATIDVDYMNTDVRPQDDFFMYSNEAWLKDNPVPASESRWGSFNELDLANKKKLTALLEEFKKSESNKGDIQQILGDYYASFTNMSKRNALGVSEIKGDLDRIHKLNSKKSISSTIGWLHSDAVSALFSFGVGQDMKNPDYHIASFRQGGIGLPNKDYYLEDSKEDIRKEYKKYIEKITTLLPEYNLDAKSFSENVMLFETKLAEHMMSRAEMRVPEHTYNKYNRHDAIDSANQFDLETYFASTGIESFDSLIVAQPTYLSNLSTMVEIVDLPVWKDYLFWCLINDYANHLDDGFVNAHFEFYGKVLRGKSEMKPMNQRAIDEITNMNIGELLGKAFVGRHFSDAAMQRVNTMVDNLLIVYESRIKQLEWMNEDTKKEALNKLSSIGRKLGFPNKWEDFSALDLNADNYVHNVQEAARFSKKKNLAKLHQPVDKDEWGMPAHMVNAYYHPLLNEIAFPAGIMQPPFFSENYEDALNYGRMGMVIGHEFTHGFDDMGSKFAADGSFTNWWSEEDRASFEERTQKLGKTFADFCPVDDHCVNPDLTMGENIADLGGLTMAYHAYTRTEEFQSGVLRKGFTPAQRFFIAYAQLWKINYTEEELKNRIANDPHSPGMYRVNGPLMNCPEFFDAFEVQEGDNMRKSADKIARIW